MKLNIALDWTPNTIHTGLYVAFAKGWYASEGLEVSFLSPEEDNFNKLPVERILSGEAHFGIGPSESVIESNINGRDIIAIASILQNNASAIATLASSGIDKPSKLAGKTYAALEIPFENCVVSNLITNAGGSGMYRTIVPDRLQTWEGFLRKESDFIWIYKPVEGIEASEKGIGLNYFSLEDFKIPYGPCPVLYCQNKFLMEHLIQVSNFLKASEKGYKYCLENPEEAANILMELGKHHSISDHSYVLKSQRAINRFYLTENNRWGEMKNERWQNYLDWLFEKGAINERIIGSILYHDFRD